MQIVKNTTILFDPKVTHYTSPGRRRHQAITTSKGAIIFLPMSFLSDKASSSRTEAVARLGELVLIDGSQYLVDD